MTIRAAVSAEDYALARSLLREYLHMPGVIACAAGFDEELAALEQRYRAVLLALEGERALGCGAWRVLEPGVAEIKRVYVRSEARGLGVGRSLVQSLLDEMRGVGVVRLDTAPEMRQAIKLYESLGFRRIPAYSASNPPDALCYERTTG